MSYFDTQELGRCPLRFSSMAHLASVSIWVLYQNKKSCSYWSIVLSSAGKTKLAMAIAGEAEAAFLSVGPGDILSKYVGESEAAVRGLFKRGKGNECLLIRRYRIVSLMLFLQIQHMKRLNKWKARRLCSSWTK